MSREYINFWGSVAGVGAVLWIWAVLTVCAAIRQAGMGTKEVTRRNRAAFEGESTVA